MSNGQGCTCNAWAANECACGADWTPQEVYDLRAENTALRARVKELEEANQRLRTVPMKYRRMEFNAQLQQEVQRLEAENAALRASPASAPAWTHSCNALCIDGLELWIPQCPHCGKPAPTPPVSEDRKDPVSTASYNKSAMRERPIIGRADLSKLQIGVKK